VSTESFRNRLDALNRQPLSAHEEAGVDVEGIRRRIRRLRREVARRPIEPVVYRRDTPRVGRSVRLLAPLPVGPPVALQEVARGLDAAAPQGGRAYVIANRLEEAGDRWAFLCGAFRAKVFTEGARLVGRVHEDGGHAAVQPEDVVLLDLETTGLASTPLFLIGTLVWEGEALLVRQYFARDYAEEGAAISLFLAATADKKLMVSFNGKSFDLPYIRTRAAANGIPFALPVAHLDMVHACRRAWSRALPDCRLQTLESHICGRVRRSDIQGSEIPDAYHAFVRTGNAAQIAQILEHNMMDLATLAELLVRLPIGT